MKRTTKKPDVRLTKVKPPRAEYKRDYYERTKHLKVGRVRAARIKDPSYYLWSKARTRARRYGIRFNIKPKHVIIPKRCPVLGCILVPLSGGYDAPTLDRFDNSLGYIKGNVHVISYKANTMKSDATFEEIKDLYKWMRGLK